MDVKIQKLTDEILLQDACSMTMHGKESKITLEEIYRCEHSPIRTQIFWIKMFHIPQFVSVHFVRHKIGVEHFVSSLRDDTYGAGTEDRWHPVNHSMLINAQSLINLARKRLCLKSHKATVKVMRQIKKELLNIDFELSNFLVPECIYRSNVCYELKPCGEFF